MDNCGNQITTEHITVVVGSQDEVPGTTDDDDNRSSSADSICDDTADYKTMCNEVTAQLAAAGPIGVAAAAAITSSKKGKKIHHSFETNPSIRKRHHNRLLRKLKQTIDEFAVRVGQQAIVLVVTPNQSYKVFGAKPLEDVLKNLRGLIMEELETALATQAPPTQLEDPTLFELPPLIIDGIPTPVEKMTQAQLRAFIPLMLKYSTGRGKPGWGREFTKPPWWPKDLPWANVRMDARSEEEKQKVSWTHALRQIVINCYKFHGREDLLPAFTEEDERANAIATANANYASVLHTIPVGIVQVDPNNPIITLPDGTTAHIQEMAMGDGSQVHTIQAITEGGSAGEVVDFNSVTEASLNSEGQLLLTSENGQVTVVANIQHLQTNSDGTVCLTPIVTKSEPNMDENMETLMVTSGGVTHSVMIPTSGTSDPQVVQVYSLNDSTVLTKAMQGISEVKSEETVISQ